VSMKHIMSDNNSSGLTEVQPGDSQPNAVDLRVAKLFKMKPNQFELMGNKKVHRGSEEILPDEDDCWNLEPGTYEIIMDNMVAVAEGYAGWVITRSTLNRNGLWISSGLYDAGYHGIMAGALHVEHGPAKIKKGSRVGQFIMFEAETLSMYDGDYGIGKEHDKKYGN